MSSTPDGLQSATQTLRIDFAVPDRGPGYIDASLQADTDPHAWGLHLIFPGHPLSEFVGFPVCHATVTSLGAQGYASMYGWLQLFRASAGSVLTEQDAWEMDPIPIHGDLETPFAWFGPNPSLFDAPVRIATPRIDWSARSFLMYAGDALMSKTVAPLACFEWGFSKEGETIRVKSLVRKEVGAFSEHLELLREKYPSWTFNSPNV